ncbi:hypothetical protein Sipo8835_11525 [Streptomyces ipomoeae]|jgi:hypothetical protein|uniref:Uncharacterized protein n=1 Tax=Streptomyces ipomoeae TaxID=103232 RepID=A0AAE8W6U7_9ACTN|nr:hypothetical protein [Streptomyces ipomoeae]MDX2693708.1 hypothetical protein [Streptomyces ipomoeae]MDX2826200.1 hypothetical protein [Streptomyces ipomoeae]MDX2839407.1 hypothetical protein [Streptomyces ipomoeae]MDX2879733.1 hypothetical protein [Streptomyces ipomoeae]MDX2936723.1 hypothetical protein [Streptomyces ipomoeae]
MDPDHDDGAAASGLPAGTPGAYRLTVDVPAQERYGCTGRRLRRAAPAARTVMVTAAAVVVLAALWATVRG